MKKIKKLLLTAIIIGSGIVFLNKFAMANPVTNPTSAVNQWNFQQQQLGGQLEYDKRRAQQSQHQQYQSYTIKKYRIVVWNDKTGNYITGNRSDYDFLGGRIGGVNDMNKSFRQRYGGEKANKNMTWKDSDKTYNILVIGRNIKSNKWEVYRENYYNEYKKILDMYRNSSPEERFSAINYSLFEFEEKLLDKCSEKADYCKVILSFRNGGYVEF